MRQVSSRSLTAFLLLVLAASVALPRHNTLRAEQKKIILRHADLIEGGGAMRLEATALLSAMWCFRTAP